jgi:quinolinate synthase
MQKRARMLVAERDGGKKDFDPFPSLVVSSDGIEAKGSYAEAQVRIKVFKFPSY